MIQDRTEGGKFAPKSSEPRHVRTIRLTDTTWEKMGYTADKRRITRADLVEQMAADGVFEDEAEVENSQPLQANLVHQIEVMVEEILNDPTVTRSGKDKGAVKRGLQALLNRLQ